MIVIITGKAGSGKSTLRSELLRREPSFSKAISYTTRSPRPGEKDGVDYCFLSKEEFQSNLDIFLKREENGNLYGVNRNSFQNKNIISILDLNGIKEIIRYLPQEDIRLIHLAVSNAVLVDRLSKRGTPQHVIFQRLCKDQDINQDNLKTNFPHLPLLILKNETIADSLEKTIQFIGESMVQNKQMYPLQNFMER